MSKIIEVRNLVKRYKKTKENAVDGISFTVNKGEFFAFLIPGTILFVRNERNS